MNRLSHSQGFFAVFQEVDYQASRPSRDYGDRYVEVMGDFLSLAEALFSDLESHLESAKEQVRCFLCASRDLHASSQSAKTFTASQKMPWLSVEQFKIAWNEKPLSRTVKNVQYSFPSR